MLRHTQFFGLQLLKYKTSYDKKTTLKNTQMYTNDLQMCNDLPNVGKIAFTSQYFACIKATEEKIRRLCNSINLYYPLFTAD